MSRLARGEECHAHTYRPHLVWFRGHFIPARAFEQVQPFFEAAARLRGTDRREEYHKACDAICRLGLQLESPEGETLDPHFVCIEDQKAGFHY